MSAGDRLRLVLDPNILISAAIKPGGSAEQALLAWEDERMDLLVCPTLLGEVGNVLARAKFSSVISPDLGRRYATLLEQEATFVADPKDPPRETPVGGAGPSAASELEEHAPPGEPAPASPAPRE